MHRRRLPARRLDYFLGMLIGLTLPQSLPSQRPLLCSSIFRPVPYRRGGLHLYCCRTPGLLYVTVPSPELGGCVQTNENFMVLPLRAVGACSHPLWEATSLRSIISCVMHSLMAMPEPPLGAICTLAWPSCPASSCADQQACSPWPCGLRHGIVHLLGSLHLGCDFPQAGL